MTPFYKILTVTSFSYHVNNWVPGARISYIFCFWLKSPLCFYALWFSLLASELLAVWLFKLLHPPPWKSPNISSLWNTFPSPIAPLCRNYCIYIFCLRCLGIIDRFALPLGGDVTQSSCEPLKAHRRDYLWLWIRARAKKCGTVLSGAVAHRSISFIIPSYLWPTTHRAT